MFAFGILTDFRTALFPGSARLVELADRMNVLQVEALCWCGKRATHNARTENGEMVVEGEVIVVGDVDERRRAARRGRPTRCSAASTTAAGSPPPAPRRSSWPPSRCPSATDRRVLLDLGAQQDAQADQQRDDQPDQRW